MTVPPESLTDRVARRAAASVRGRRVLGWRLSATELRFAAALAALIALAPLLTITGGAALRARVEADRRGIAEELRVRMAPQEARRAAAAQLRDAVRMPALAATLERVARAVPPDAQLVSAARGADGRLTLEIAVRDPDELRGAIRRDPVLAALRETGQRRLPDARVVVTLRGAP